MENMRIAYLFELRLPQEQIEKMPKAALSVFTTLAFIANEISVFQALFLASKPEKPRDQIIKKKARIQNYSLIRALNAKTFEGLYALQCSKDLLVRQKIYDQLPKSSVIFDRTLLMKSQIGYRVSKKIRDKIANHIIPNVVNLNLTHVAAGGERTMYLHKSSGDSFYPIAEEFVFGSLLNHIAKEEGLTTGEIMKIWMEWSTDVARELSDGFEQLSIEIIEIYFPEVMAKKVSPYVEPEFDGGFRKKTLSVFNSV